MKNESERTGQPDNLTTGQDVDDTLARRQVVRPSGQNVDDALAHRQVVRVSGQNVDETLTRRQVVRVSGRPDGQSKKRILYFAAALLLTFAAGCGESMPSSPAPSGYEPVRHRLRFSNRDLTRLLTPSNGVIKVAIESSSGFEMLIWDEFQINEGSITIMGSNFTLLLEKDKKTTLDLQNDGVYTGVLNRASWHKNKPPEYNNIPFLIYPRSSSDTPDSKVKPYIPRVVAEVQRKNNNVFSELYSVESNGWFCVEIPYTRSANFQGKIGKLRLPANMNYK